ncbi:MAG: polysulfide reductase NrfD [Myxococcales bacterium]|nr:polysulfide reductase NrfD [Myxococcales bacterium]
MNNAIVTLDVLHQGPMWGWYVTMNFWAKSVATGVMLILPFLLMNKHDSKRIRLLTPALSFVFLNITLLFTLLDLHQPFRFWHMFVYPQFRSVLNLGAWFLSGLNGFLLLHVFFAWKDKEDAYDKLLPVTWVVAAVATIYTAGLMGQANARELWQVGTELPQMILAALMAGSSALLLAKAGGEGARRPLALILGLATGVSLLIFLAEIWLAPQKSEEAEYMMHLLLSGELKMYFLPGLLLGFVLPVAAVLGARRNPLVMAAASVLSLTGLWLVKHAWLLAPQLLPLS